MCQPLPAARCSSHTRKRLNKEIARLEVLQAQSNIKSSRALNDAIDAQNQVIEEARREYHSSRAGIKELETDLAEAVTAKQKGRIDELKWRLENARTDREDHLLASKIISTPTAMDPRTSPSVMSARKTESLHNLVLAKATNANAPLNVVRRMTSQALQSKNERLKAERRFLLEGRGITSPHVSTLGKVNNDEQNSFVYLKSTDFGRLGQFFPSGAFAKITHVESDEVGNVFATIEGTRMRRLPADMIVVQQR